VRVLKGVRNLLSRVSRACADGRVRSVVHDLSRRLYLTVKYRFIVPNYDGMMDEARCKFLYNTVINYRGEKGIIVEIGAYKGCSTTWLAIAGQRNGFASLVAIDLFAPGWHRQFGTYEEFMKRMKRNKLERFVEAIRGDSKEVIKKWDKEIAVLHIDGDHTYEAVKADVNNYIPYLKRNGIVIFDDYDSCHPDVKKVVNELLNGGYFQIIGLVKETPGYGGGSIALKKLNPARVIHLSALSAQPDNHNHEDY